MTEPQVTDFDTALKRIIQTANSDSLLAKGLHEVCKAIENKDEKLKAKYVMKSVRLETNFILSDDTTY